MDLIKTLQTRYTTKSYDAKRRIPDDIAHQLFEALRLSPSSVNSQPWHFIVADDAAGKARVAKATSERFDFNTNKILNASHVVVLCSRSSLPASYLETVLEQEQADGRYADKAAREAVAGGRAFFVGVHEKAGDVQTWAMKQTYIAQGFLLLSAGLLGVDATPVEGFDAEIVDKEFGLAEKELTATVIVALGYHAEADFNAKLPKSRLPYGSVFSKA
ncbi:oxygen-insensitive NAD(P)H nitroreductase [Acetobacter thailandicus]|uniref:oxygen-insensitive NAD(P)H nitroreductase n=1 Tax=Acetobacter thailandicus TaxID=1502842 RepID=UPI001BA4C0D9|nr:oxygen-insensitive NAD(P)H nitroreductase [Acetobacter thailandicus]MBS0980250.1 oxygen-insensitive NAD(P)H nitroreductase [Acetobacter thailandicus]